MCQSIPECNSKPLVWDLSVAKIRSSMTTVGVGAPKSTWESQKKMGSCIFLNMSHVFLNVDSVYFLWKLLWNLFSGNMSAQDLVLSVKFAFSCWEKLHQEKMTKPLSRGYVTKTLGLFHNKHYFAHKTFFFLIILNLPSSFLLKITEEQLRLCVVYFQLTLWGLRQESLIRDQLKHLTSQTTKQWGAQQGEDSLYLADNIAAAAAAVFMGELQSSFLGIAVSYGQECPPS